MNTIRRLLAFAAALSLLLLPAGAEQAEVFDPNEWAAVEALASVADLSGSVASAVLLEKETGACLYALNEHERLAPASVTKVMTLLLVVERIEAGLMSLTDTLTCSAYAASMGGSQIYMEEGEQMSVDELLKAVAVSSANDAAVVLAEQIAGSEAAFVEKMNRRAEELGMADTVFSNCTGLPGESEHLTSAWDIGLMSRALIAHDSIKEYTTIWTDTVRGGQFGLANTNKLIRFYPGATGLKTGFTQEARYCLAATAMRDGVEYIAVVMHAESSDARFESAKLLLNHAFANYTVADILPDEALPPVPVSMGVKAYLQPALDGENKLVLERSQAAGLRKELRLVENVEAPVAAGQVLGELAVYAGDGTELARVDVTAPEAVARVDFARMFLRYLRLLLTGRS